MDGQIQSAPAMQVQMQAMAQERQAAAPPAVISLESRRDFAATVSGFTALLKERGLTLFADIDQQAAAGAAGATLRPTRLLLFGNPAGGTPVMQANPHAALELPLRVVIWEDGQGRGHIDYLDVTGVLQSGYGLSDEQLRPLGAVAQLVCAFAASE